MNVRGAVLLLLLLSHPIFLSCSLAEAERAVDVADEYDHVVDQLAGVVDSRLARFESSLDGVQESLVEIRSRRLGAGESENDPLDWEEWALIGSGLLAGLLGLNQVRDRKYKQIGKEVTHGNPQGSRWGGEGRPRG